MPTTVTHHIKSFLVASFFLAFFSSCKSKDDITTLKALEEGLISSNKAINMSSEMALHALKNKLDDPRTYSKAEIWFPKAQKIQYHSNEMFNFIEGLKKESKPDNAEISSLYKRLMKYKNDVLATDSTIRETFNSRIIITTKSFDESKPNIEEFKKTFFNNASKEATSAILTKFQNNIKIIENKLLVFCNEQIGVTDRFIDDFPKAIIQQNAYSFKAGETIEIKAGIGLFNRLINEVVSIKGTPIMIDENGLATFKMKISENPGKYQIPVMISFYNQDGKAEAFTYAVEYTVAKPCDQ